MSVTKEDTVGYMNLIASSIDQDTLINPDNASIIDAVYEEDYTDAERRCLERIQEDESDYFAWSFYGLVLMLRGDVSKVREILDRAYLTDKNKVLALNLLGDYHFGAGDNEQGEAAYYLSLNREYDQLHPRKMLYYQYMKRKEFQKALRVIEPALRVDPDDEDTWSYIRDCITQMGYIGFAEGVIYYLVKDFPQKHMTWYLRSNLLLALDKLEEAETAVRKAIELNNGDSHNWVLLATIPDRSGNSDKAVECCREAVSLEPKNPYAWYSYSMLLLKIGKRVESQNAASKAVALNPKKAKEVLRYLSRQI
jgi:tetratricopeptide (TPR) repeat protein